jgi:hypothetical protein
MRHIEIAHCLVRKDGPMSTQGNPFFLEEVDAVLID